MIPHFSPPVLAQAVSTSLPSPGLTALNVGQTLTGTVQKILPEGQALLQIKGQPLLVSLPQQFTPGQRFTATVTQTVPHLVLRLQEETPQTTVSSVPIPEISTQQAIAGPLTAARLLPYLHARQPFGQVVTTLQLLLRDNVWLREIAPEISTRLQETLTVLSAPDDAPPTATHLQSQVQRSGLNHEAQVQQAILGSRAFPKTLPGNTLSLLSALLQTVRTIATQKTTPYVLQATAVLPRLEKLAATLTPTQAAAPAQAGLSSTPQKAANPLEARPATGFSPVSQPLSFALRHSLTTLTALLRHTPWLQEIAPTLPAQLHEALLALPAPASTESPPEVLLLPHSTPPVQGQTVRGAQLDEALLALPAFSFAEKSPGAEPEERAQGALLPQRSTLPFSAQGLSASLRNALSTLLQTVQGVAADQTSGHAAQASALLPWLDRTVTLAANVALPPASSARAVQTPPGGASVSFPQAAQGPLSSNASPGVPPGTAGNQPGLASAVESLTTVLRLVRQTPWLQQLFPTLPEYLETALTFSGPALDTPREAVPVPTQAGPAQGKLASLPPLTLSLASPVQHSSLKSLLGHVVQTLRAVAADHTAGHAPQATTLLPLFEKAATLFEDATFPLGSSGILPPTFTATSTANPSWPVASLRPLAPLLPQFPGSSLLPAGLEALGTLHTLLHQTPWLQQLAPTLTAHLERAIASLPSPSPTPAVHSSIQAQEGRETTPAPSLLAGKSPQPTPFLPLKNPLQGLLQAVQTLASDRTAAAAPQAEALVPFLEKTLEVVADAVPQPRPEPAGQQESAIVASLAVPTRPVLTTSSPWSVALPANDPLAALLSLLRQTPWLEELAPSLPPQLEKALVTQRPPATTAPESVFEQTRQEPLHARDTLPPSRSHASRLSGNVLPDHLKDSLTTLLQAVQTIATEKVVPHAPQAVSLLPLLKSAIAFLDASSPPAATSVPPPQPPVSIPQRFQAVFAPLPLSSARSDGSPEPPTEAALKALSALLREAPWLQEQAPTLLAQLDKALTTTKPQPPSVAPETIGEKDNPELLLPAPDDKTLAPQQNVKGQLLELFHAVRTVAADPAFPYAAQATEAMTHLDKALHAIEFQQILNATSWQQEQSFIVPLGLPWSTPATDASLLIQRYSPEPQEGAASVPAYLFVMTLDVSALGPLRIETRLHGKQVSTTIKAAQPEAADFMLPQVSTLVTALHALGFQAEVGCKVQEGSDRHDPLTEQLAHLQRRMPTRLVDVTL